MWKLLVVAVVVAAGVSYVGVYYFNYGAQGIDEKERTGPQRSTAPRISTTTLPTTHPVEPDLNTTMLVELPRQAVLIATAERAGVAVDRSVDFDGETADGPLGCRVTFQSRHTIMTVELLGADRIPVKTYSFKPPALSRVTPDYPQLARQVEAWIDTDITPLLPVAAPRPASGEARVPKELFSCLYRVDPLNAFEAARALHEQVTESGPTPQRLSMLVRAYANLGDATRHLYSRHGSVFFARALIYVERLMRLSPGSIDSLAARGYAYALLGLPKVAQADFDAARKLGPLPDWAEAADDLANFRTRDLTDRAAAAEGDISTLSSYFALLTVQHSNLQSIVMNLSELALKADPAAARVLNIMAEEGGTSTQHVVTPRLFTVAADALTAAAAEPGFPQAAKQSATTQPTGAKKVLSLLDALNKEAAGPGQLLPWSVFASITRDEWFLAGMRRAYFVGQILNTNATPSLRQMWPLVKGHRFANVLAGYDKSGAMDAAASDGQFVYGLSDNDFAERLRSLPEHEKELAGKQPSMRWEDGYGYRSDETAFDQAASLHAYAHRELNAIKFVSMMKGETAEDLAALCPDHPSAIAEQIVNRWTETKPRSADLERDFGQHPQVAFALARTYRGEKRFDDAERLLRQVIAISPDPAVYEELADLYKDQGNAEKWLELKQTYLQSTDDYGLDHARANESIAYEMLRMNRADLAVRYAREAADTGASWGMRVYAACLTQLGRYGEAEATEKQNQQRYPGSFAWYRWCQLTGRGDLEAARALSRRAAQELHDDPNPDQQNDIAVFYLLEGELDHAKQCWQQASRAEVYDLLQQALIAIEQHDPDTAEQLASRATSGGNFANMPAQFRAMLADMTTDDPLRVAAYRQAAVQIQECADDDKSVPSRHLEAFDDPKSKGKPYRGAICYLMGRICELHGQKDDALYWYHAGRDNQETSNSCAPLTAQALRRLGEDYFPSTQPATR